MSDTTGLPPEFDPRNQRRTGIEVLDHGLPALPDVLTYQMSLPVAFWKAASCAVVLFLCYSRSPIDGTFHPKVRMGGFYREGNRWAAREWWFGTGWSHDPVADRGSLRDLDGQAIAGGSGSYTPHPKTGFPASVVTGRVSPAVTHLALVQDGLEDRRELRTHLGAWVVCTEGLSSYRVNALDNTGAVVGSITGPSRPSLRQGNPWSSN